MDGATGTLDGSVYSQLSMAMENQFHTSNIFLSPWLVGSSLTFLEERKGKKVDLNYVDLLI